MRYLAVFGLIAGITAGALLACTFHVDGDVKVKGMPDAITLVIVPGCSDGGELDAAALPPLPIDASALEQFLQGAPCR